MKEINFPYGGKDIKLFVHDKPETLRLEALSRAIIRNDTFYEEHILSFIQSMRIKLHTIVEIGANIGNHAVFFDEFLDYERLLCFEPLPENFEILRKNTENRPKVETYNMALGDVEGRGRAIAKRDNMGASFVVKDNKGPTVLRTLDGFHLTNVSLIKIDVEGFEKEVLTGAIETIIKNKPIIVFEDSPEEWLDELGYTVLKRFPRINIYTSV